MKFVVHTGALGETVSVIVTVPGVDGQVKIGVALTALSNVPAVADQANVGLTDPAEAVADNAIGASIVVSNGETDIELMLAHTCVDPFTTTVPASGVAPVQIKVTFTAELIPRVTSKVAETEQVIEPSTDVAFNVMV